MLSDAEQVQEDLAKSLENSAKLAKCSTFYEALVALNKSSIAAAGDSAVLSKLFLEKSRIYYKLGHYENCLRCLEDAERLESGNDEAEALRGECLSALNDNGRSSPPSTQNIYANFIKLSHPPHRRLPFIVDCLELRENDVFGKHVITNRNLKAGDVIAMEKSYFHFVSPHAVFERCFNCFRSNKLDLKTFGTSASVLFCSMECHDETLRKFKQNAEAIRTCLTDIDVKRKMSLIMNGALRAFGSIDQMKKQFHGETVNKTIFDFDCADLSDEEMRRVVFVCNSSVLPKTDSMIRKYLEATIHIPNIELRTFLVDFVSRLILNYLRNGVKVPSAIAKEPVGGLFLPFVAMINHSCDPNVYASFVEEKCIIFVIKPIRANEQIFLNYRKTFIEQGRAQRQTELMSAYEFACNCDACNHNYPMPSKQEKLDKTFKLPAFGHFQRDDAALLDELRTRLDYLNEKCERHPYFEYSATLIRVKELLRTACERISFGNLLDKAE